MCRVLAVSRSGYYRWTKNGLSNRAKENITLTYMIKEIFEDSKKTYGSPRIREQLNRNGFTVSQRRVAKLMRKSNLYCRRNKKFRVTTSSNHAHPISPNLLKQDFKVERINQVWVSDITYVHTGEGWLYLTIILDLFDRQIIGWNLSKRLKTTDTIIPAWNMATDKRQITKDLIFHSDRGVQYAAHKFRNLIKSNKLITQSMSRKANCWDNAVAESFFKTLKVECVYQEIYKTRKEAELSIFEYIEIWYNRKRLHSGLNYLTPIEYENQYNQLINVA
ncbi:UNVERIFIED_CONTAM: hypothetical protein GTU68_039695 [Idotea baltica]|nr:hypothetical protein [Idotea baltica]